LDNLIIFVKNSLTKLAIITIVIYQLYFILISNGSFFELKRKKEFLQFQSSSNNVIKKNNQELSNEIEKLKSGYEIFESIARKELGMIRENEVFVKILY
jgi:cell division protein FtsB